MKIHLEIKSGEGGRDAEMLTHTQLGIYTSYFDKNRIKYKVLEHS